jgi:hypothetical protein
MSTPSNKRPPSNVYTGYFIAAICLIAGVVMFFMARDFRGFFDRGQGEAPIPIWLVLLGLALLNFIYGSFSLYIHRRSVQDPLPPPDVEQKK